jgi:hypothetical protein
MIGEFGKVGAKKSPVKVSLGFVAGQMVIRFTSEKGIEFELIVNLGFFSRWIDRVKDLVDGEEAGA